MNGPGAACPSPARVATGGHGWGHPHFVIDGSVREATRRRDTLIYIMTATRVGVGTLRCLTCTAAFGKRLNTRVSVRLYAWARYRCSRSRRDTRHEAYACFECFENMNGTRGTSYQARPSCPVVMLQCCLSVCQHGRSCALLIQIHTPGRRLRPSSSDRWISATWRHYCDLACSL